MLKSLTEEQIKKIYELSMASVVPNDIAKQIGCSDASVSIWKKKMRKQLGIEFPNLKSIKAKKQFKKRPLKDILGIVADKQSVAPQTMTVEEIEDAQANAPEPQGYNTLAVEQPVSEILVTDLGLATALVVAGHTLIRAKKNSTVWKFFFDNSLGVAQSKTQFYNRELPVDAYSYFVKYKYLKDKMHQLTDGTHSFSE